MKIKLALLERDKSYLMRIVSTFGTKYSDKFEIYSFTDPDAALGTLNSARIDVLLASDVFDLDISQLPRRCAFAYLVDSMGIDMLLFPVDTTSRYKSFVTTVQSTQTDRRMSTTRFSPR